VIEFLLFLALAVALGYVSIYLDGWEQRRDARRRNR
jgi:hypothetical protein